jgi:hypothetical protein
LGELFSALATFLLQLLQGRHHGDEEGKDDGDVDVGDDSKRKKREVLKGSAGEEVQILQKAGTKRLGKDLTQGFSLYAGTGIYTPIR